MQDKKGRGVRSRAQFPSQKYLKCIYNWSNSHKTAIEYLQKSSDVQKDKKTSTQPGRTKGKKEKNKSGLCSGEGAVKEESFVNLGKTAHHGEIILEREIIQGEFQHLNKLEQQLVCGKQDGG